MYKNSHYWHLLISTTTFRWTWFGRLPTGCVPKWTFVNSWHNVSITFLNILYYYTRNEHKDGELFNNSFITRQHMHIRCWEVCATVAETVSTFPVLDFLTEPVCTQRSGLITKVYAHVLLTCRLTVSSRHAAMCDKIYQSVHTVSTVVSWSIHSPDIRSSIFTGQTQTPRRHPINRVKETKANHINHRYETNE